MAAYGNGNGHSLSELEQQAETSRAELALTVEELQSRVSPRALKRDAKDYVRSTGQQFYQTVEAKARENPMAAVAVAAGLAVPLWRVVSKLPAPLLLIGAGLAMAQRRPQAGWPGSRDYGTQAASIAETVKDKAADVKAQAADMASSVGSTISQKMGDTTDSARRMMHDATGTMSETAAQASRMASETWERGRMNAADMLERHPLLVGGAALVAGGLLASALPVTRQENRLMGRMADDVKSRGQDIANQGLEAAKEAASDVYEDVASQAREQGLTPETARSAVREAMDKAGTVVERTTAAVEDAKSKPARLRRS